MRIAWILGLFAVGLAMGFGSSSLSDNPRESDSSSSSGGHESTGTAQPAGRATPVPVESLDTVLTDLAAASADTLAPLEPGDGTIRGRVIVAETDEPLVGVRVVASVKAPDSSDQPEDDVDITALVRSLIEHTHRHHSLTREAVTDAEGKFTIDGIRDDLDYDVAAALDGWLVAQPPDALRAGNEAEFLAYRSRSLTVSVVHRQGRPIETGWVLTYDRHRQTIHTPWSSDSPVVIVPAETEGARFRSASGEQSNWTLIPSETEGSALEFELSSEVRLHVIINDPPGDREPFFGCGVRWEALDPGELDEGETPEGILFVRSEQREVSGVLPGAGRYRVRLTNEDGFLGDEQVVEAEAGANTITFDCPSVPESRLATVTVLRPDGTPARDVKFVLSAWYGDEEDFDFDEDFEAMNAWTDHYAKTMRREDGSFWIDLGWQATDEELPEAITLIVKSPRYGEIQERWELASSPSITVHFEEGAQLAIAVADVDDPGLGNRLFVRVGEQEHGPLGLRRAFDLGPTSPGEVEVTAVLHSDSDFLPLASTTVTLQSGDNHAEISIPPLYQLTLRFDPEFAGRVVSIESEPSPEWFRTARVSADGVATFPWMIEGRHFVRVQSVDQAMTVHVANDVTVEFHPTPRDCLLVLIDGPDSQLHQWGFAHGDRIIALDDRELDERSTRYAVMDFLTPGAKTVTVLRGGTTRRLEFTVSTENQFLDDTSRLYPASRSEGP